MPDKQLFDIIFTGDIADGFDLVEVKRKAAQLFKMEDQKISSLFQGKRLALKKNLDEAAANKYRKVLSQIGMIVVVQSQGDIAPVSESPQQQSESKPQVTHESSVPSATASLNWEIEQVGVLLVAATPSPSPAVTAPTYTLAPQPCHLLTPEERPEPSLPPNLQALSTITLGNVGAELLEIEEKTTTKELDVDCSHLSTKPVGELLLDGDEKKVLLVKEIDTSAIQFVE
jgi:hypothetical protein